MAGALVIFWAVVIVLGVACAQAFISGVEAGNK